MSSQVSNAERALATSPSRGPAPSAARLAALADSLVCVGLVLAAFSPLLAAELGSSDDYAHLVAGARDPWVVARGMMGDGRWLKGLLQVLWLRLFPDVASLVWPRAVFIAAVGAAACVWRATLRWAGWGRAPAVLMAVALAACPGFVGAGRFSIGAAHALAVALGLLAGLLVARSHLASRPGPSLTAAALLLVAALAFYQPGALAICAVAALYAWSHTDGVRTPVRRLWRFAAVGGAAVAVYVPLAWWLLPRWLDVTVRAKVAVSPHPATKLAAFCATALRDSLQLFWIWRDDPLVEHYRSGASLLQPDALLHPSGLVALSVGFVVVAGAAGRFRRPVAAALLGAGVIVASYSVNLVASTPWTPLRTQVALGMTVAVFFWLGLTRLLPPLRRSSRWRVAVLGLWCLLAVAAQHLSTRRFVTTPLAGEWRALSEAVCELPADTRRVVLVPLTEAEHLGAGVRYDLGRPASATAWAAVPMVKLALEKCGWTGPAPRITVARHGTGAAGEILLSARAHRDRR